MRLPYTANPPETTNVEEEQILKRVLDRRGGTLIPLDRTLLHAPKITDGFNSFMIALRTQNTLPPDVREIAFCRVAALTGCEYEWEIHSPIAREAGVSERGLQTIHNKDATDTTGLDSRQAAVLRYADAMTKTAVVPEEVFDTVKRFFTEKEMVELTASIAGFNTVARFCVALDVGEKNAR
ncbi:putative 4-carboxymuconolactone decarboxylase [Xylogone sp. PMI_703]|nr:putative 4-carboxymuconolactone decarboxylase [Xylogone sp. PMI_703]